MQSVDQAYQIFENKHFSGRIVYAFTILANAI